MISGRSYQSTMTSILKHLAIVLAVALIPRPVITQAVPSRSSGTFFVTDVRVFDGERTLEHRKVLVRDGVIREIAERVDAPANAEAIDGHGRTLLPGLIDAHMHLSDNPEADLRQALSLGVTAVFDMFTAGDRFERIKALRAANRPDLADVRTAGVGASAPGGHPSIMGGPAFPTITAADQATAFVDTRIAEGSDYIKIIYDDLAVAGMSVPMIDRQTLTALIAAAHARGKKAIVHVMAEQRAREAIEAGADGLAHLFVGAAVSPDFSRLVSARHLFVIPTIGVLHGICGRPNGEAVLNDALLGPYIRTDLRPMMTMSLSGGRVNSCSGTDEALRQLAKAHVAILAGTDAPTPTQTYGASLHGELEALVGVGLSPIEALIAATSAPATAFGLNDRGHIRRGARADLLLVDGNPTADILATRRIERVWKSGVQVARSPKTNN